MTTEQPTAEAPTEEKPSDRNQYIHQLERENKALRQENRHFKLAGPLGAIGLDPDVGLGKAIGKEYDGDLTPEAVQAYAQEEYGYTAEDVGTPEVPKAQEIEQAQQAQEQIVASSEPVVPAPPTTQIEEADQALADPEATADHAKAALGLKLGAFMEENFPS